MKIYIQSVKYNKVYEPSPPTQKEARHVNESEKDAKDN